MEIYPERDPFNCRGPQKSKNCAKVKPSKRSFALCRKVKRSREAVLSWSWIPSFKTGFSGLVEDCTRQPCQNIKSIQLSLPRITTSRPWSSGTLIRKSDMEGETIPLLGWDKGSGYAEEMQRWEVCFQSMWNARRVKLPWVNRRWRIYHLIVYCLTIHRSLTLV